MSIDFGAMGNNVRVGRERMNLTRRELAAKAGIGYKHIRRIENGTGKPSVAAAVAIANILGVGVGQLI